MVRGKELEKRVCIRHKFGDHGLNPAVETIILGTFNPGHEANKAEFFYSNPRNQLWSLLISGIRRAGSAPRSTR